MILSTGGACSGGGGLQAHTKGGTWRGWDPGPHPRGKLRGIRSRPTPKGEIEGDQVQAHTQGGNLRGIRSRPIPKGEIEGDQVQAHTQGGSWGGSGLAPLQTATAAGGTHPTRMQSCLENCLSSGHFYVKDIRHKVDSISSKSDLFCHVNYTLCNKVASLISALFSYISRTWLDT